MSNWKILLLHTRKNTLLKRTFEAAFPGAVTSLHVPELGRSRKERGSKVKIMNYFNKHIYSPKIWGSRVLTIYGSGRYHHYTYALSRLAAKRRGLEGPEQNWTYFHVDQHRDEWGKREADGTTSEIDCASFVDSIAHDHGAVPFFIGPDVYPKKDAAGYNVDGRHIPIFSNYFTQSLQRSRKWTSNSVPRRQTGLELPATADLRATPISAYLSFDLDLLARSEIVTDYDQNDDMTLRRVCQILDKIRPYKRVFSADILGFPDWNRQHALSCLTMIILARKIMGLGIEHLLKYHTEAKRRQALLLNQDYWSDYWSLLGNEDRRSPIDEGELLEVLKQPAQ